MGTDIYLYKENADVDKDDPVEYLRVSVWQERENALLRMVFDEKHWNNKDLDERNYLIPKRYKFTTDGLQILATLVKHLESSVILGTEFQRHANPIVKMFEQQCNVIKQPGIDTMVGTEFIEEIMTFYRKGLELDQKGKEPQVVIHW